jgi:hypothetical protein
VLGRVTCETVFENGLTGVNATTEIVGPAQYSLLKLASHQVGLVMPVRVRLENPCSATRATSARRVNRSRCA